MAAGVSEGEKTRRLLAPSLAFLAAAVLQIVFSMQRASIA